jgi:signal transduction histidine kinase
MMLPAAFLATLVDYAINISLVTVAVSLAYRLSVAEVIPRLLGRGQEFLISYVGLGLVGTVLAKLFVLPDVGFFSVLTVLVPLLFARQMFFRSRALEEAHKELQEREQVLRVLSNRMAEEREDERAAIAAYLHDDLAQLLFRLSIQVDVARRDLSSGNLDDVGESLDKIKGTKQETSDRVRALIRDLHRSPLGHAGLAEAIQGFVAEAGRDSGVRFKVDVQEIRLPAPIALLIYHVTREATMNALKHADAHNMQISVREVDEEIELVIADDGKGFDTAAPGPEGHFGMAMMRDRATVGGGTFDVRSAPGAGTTITVRFPTALLQQEQESSEPAVSVPRSGTHQDGASPDTPTPGGASSSDPPASVPA